MNWIDIVSIVFVCVTMNHLGLIKAIEERVDREFPILNCPKCSSFWATLVYMSWHVGFSDIPYMLAVSFLTCYIAIWIELFEGYIDTLYLKLYDKIYNSTADTSASDSEQNSTPGTVSEL